VLCCRQVAPRHRLQAAPASLQAEFALFAFWHEAPNRTPVNSHVVVAGASDCGLSVIESLLMHERLAFNALTLLAPGGLCNGQSAAMYKADLIARLVSWLCVSRLVAEASAGFNTCCHSSHFNMFCPVRSFLGLPEKEFLGLPEDKFFGSARPLPDPGSWADNDCLSACLAFQPTTSKSPLIQLHIRDCAT